MNQRARNTTRKSTSQTKGRTTQQDSKNLSFQELIKLSSSAPSQDLGKILVDADATISINITAGGITTEIKARDGRLLGTADDLQKLSGIRTFVSQERKSASADSLDEELLILIDSLQSEIRKEDKDWVAPKTYSSEFIALVRQSSRVIHSLGLNFEKISSLKVITEEDQSSMKVLCRMAAKLIEVEVQSLKDFLIKGKLEKGFKSEALLKMGIPKWFASKLTSRLDVTQDSDINRILYPQSAKSWVSLTIKEMRSKLVKSNLAEINVHSQFVYTIATSDNFLKSFTNLKEDVNLEDETLREVNAILAVKFYLIPHCLGLTFCLEPSSKNRSQNFSGIPKFSNPADSLGTLAESFIMIATGNPRGSDPIGSFWAEVLPGIKIERSKLSASQNIAKTILDSKNDENETAWKNFFQFDTLERLKVFFKQSAKVMLLVEKSMQYTAMESKLFGKDQTTLPPSFTSRKSTSKDTTSSINGLMKVIESLTKKPTLSTDLGRLADLRENLPQRKIPERVPQAARCTLSRPGKRILANISKLAGGKLLSRRVEAWLKSFTHERIQVAAVLWLEAQFDDFFIKEIDDSSDSEEETSSQIGEDT